jgi:hypothetical protein
MKAGRHFAGPVSRPSGHKGGYFLALSTTDKGAAMNKKILIVGLAFLMLYGAWTVAKHLFFGAIMLAHGHQDSGMRHVSDSNKTMASLGSLRSYVSVYKEQHPGAPLPNTLDEVLSSQGSRGKFTVSTGYHSESSDMITLASGQSLLDTGAWGYRPDTGEVFVDCSHVYNNRSWSAW